ncbi:PadR family transcriptional regulator [Actinoplanes sp. CA-142083]|uniref:PadR family transcriptional regulator n=1 Tax=Actinoplanes sp. CA-142083 TaxID=3239903 RepID=UPI003D944735
MSLRIALLGMLAAGGPSSGYDLAKQFEGSLSHVWAARHSQIYPELNKLEVDELATVTDDGARGRKVYTITDAGRSALDSWLRTTEARQRVRSESGLRMFLLPLLPPGEAVPLLRQEAALYAAQVAELEAERERHSPPTKPGRNGWYALDLGIRQMTAIRDWASETADHLEGLGK